LGPEFLDVHLLRSLRCLHHEPSALAVQGHLLLADLPEEEDRRPRPLAESEQQLVLLNRRLDRLTHRRLRSEEAIGRDEPADPLVRTEVVVVAKVVLEPLARLGEVLRMHTVPEFATDRLPQTLALAERLRMMRACHDVRDALALEQLLEVAPAAPREVLRPLVRQDLQRLAEARRPFEQRLADRDRRHPQVQGPRHDVAAEVVEEDDQLHATPRARHHVARDVALPELAGSRSLEAPQDLTTPALLQRRCARDTRRFNCAPHAAGTDLQSAKARQEVAHLLQSEVREAPLHGDDLLAKRRRERLSPWLARAARVLEPLRAVLAVELHPDEERVTADAPDLREGRVRETRFQVRLDRRAALLRREAPLHLRTRPTPGPTPRPAARRRAGLRLASLASARPDVPLHRSLLL
jgi:hypothetical protein